VARWIRALGGRPADRDDLVQEVFAVVHRRLREFDGRNESAWLYRITVHKVRDFRRKSWLKHIFRRSTPSFDDLPAKGPTPHARLESVQKRELLERLLSNLSKTLRVTFVLFEIEGYSAKEIATMQRTSLNTVRSRVVRARAKLMRMLSAGSPPT
jgi:RNA polymerase sigma-70 factor (ECF subfamily)